MYEEDSSWLSNMFLGHEGRQNRDLKYARIEAANAALDSSVANDLAKALAARVDRLELVCETLLELVLLRKVVNREELEVLMAQVDLRDGVEDGGLNHDRPRSVAPSCTACERPINPKRAACVYCGAKIVADAVAPKRAVRLVACGKCGEQVDPRTTNFTEDGLRCDACFRLG